MAKRVFRKNALVYYSAGVAVVHLEVAGLASVLVGFKKLITFWIKFFPKLGDKNLSET
jgi:hypothetical protein